MKNQKGFSLIELMTVIIIIGIMVGIAVPTITRNLPYRRLLDGRSQVKSDLSLMRQRSLVESRSFGIGLLAASPDRYTLFEDLNDNGVFDAGTDRVITIRNLPTRINFVLAANQAHAFLRTGILNSNSAANIDLQNDKNQQKTLTVMLSGIVVD
jgi:prepilin-type N-terminal cleavage/methylation domain-containing protein